MATMLNLSHSTLCDGDDSQSDFHHEMHVLLFSKSRVKSSIGTSTLLAGFALVAMVEVELNNATPTAILIVFAMVTSLLIFVHLFSLVMATRLLPELESATKQPKFAFALSTLKGHTWAVTLVWYMSNIVGILLFLVELVMVAFVKFYPHPETNPNRYAVGVSTLAVVLVLSVIAMPFIAIHYRSISNKKIQNIDQKLEEGQGVRVNLDQTRPSARTDLSPTHHTVV